MGLIGRKDRCRAPADLSRVFIVFQIGPRLPRAIKTNIVYRVLSQIPHERKGT